MIRFFLVFIQMTVSMFSISQINKPWLNYEGGDGPGKGKRIVFISGDEEYRSEEALPMLAKILSRRFGFNCYVLFSIDPKTGEIDAMNQGNIPGLELLRKADLMFIFTRYRELPDNQMKYIDEYLAAGKPVIGLRTATHAFDYKKNMHSPYLKYSQNSKIREWEYGFGKKILGETWVDHHGKHGEEGTRGLINGIQERARNPILNGVHDIWVPTDVYAINKLDKSSEVLVYGQSTNGLDPASTVNIGKSVMPVAWTKSYTAANGKKGKVFTTTMGASIDLQNDDLRRLIVNACLWATNLEKLIPEKADVHIIGEYKPSMFGFESFRKGRKPEDMK